MRKELDCNGLSAIQRPVKPTLPCAEPRGSDAGRAVGNGRYTGHDEPSVRFISGRAGSSSGTIFTERLPLEPKAKPTVRSPGHDVTHWFELSLAPWFSIDVCDPDATPLLPCTPRSDANAPHGRYPGAGAGFVEQNILPWGIGPYMINSQFEIGHFEPCTSLRGKGTFAFGSSQHGSVTPKMIGAFAGPVMRNPKC